MSNSASVNIKDATPTPAKSAAIAPKPVTNAAVLVNAAPSVPKKAKGLSKKAPNFKKSFPTEPSAEKSPLIILIGKPTIPDNIFLRNPPFFESSPLSPEEPSLSIALINSSCCLSLSLSSSSCVSCEGNL